MTLQQMIEWLLAGVVFGALFGGPIAAILSLWLIRRSEHYRWLAIPVRAPGKGGGQ